MLMVFFLRSRCQSTKEVEVVVNRKSASLMELRQFSESHAEVA